MYEIECKICNEKFISEYKGREKGKLSKHIKNKHNISVEEYFLNYVYNNIKPKCACGCGNDVDFFKFKYNKYYLDHKNYLPLSDSQKNKMFLTNQIYNEINNKIKRKGITKEILLYYFNEFKNIRMTLNEIQEKLNIDKRTITSYWKELKISDRKEINKIGNSTKFLGFLNNLEKRKISEDELEEIVVFLEERRERISLNELKTKLNLPYGIRQIKRKLEEKYGSDLVKKYLKIGGTSNIELDFYFILKWYFGNNVKHHFKIEDKIYDYLVENLLIELDGTFWHKENSVIKNDKYKNKLALKYGYNILRIKEENINDVSLIIKIKKILKNEKI